MLINFPPIILISMMRFHLIAIWQSPPVMKVYRRAMTLKLHLKLYVCQGKAFTKKRLSNFHQILQTAVPIDKKWNYDTKIWQFLNPTIELEKFQSSQFPWASGKDTAPRVRREEYLCFLMTFSTWDFMQSYSFTSECFYYSDLLQILSCIQETISYFVE